MDEEPDRFDRLRNNGRRMREGLHSAFADTPFYVQGNVLSPVLHIKFRSDNTELAEKKLDALVDKVQSIVFIMCSNQIERF